jgi:hypothetical protein
MGITWEMIAGVVLLTLLAVLLTGPGMWSEKWGWGWLSRRRRARDGDRPERGDGSPPAPPRRRS